MAQSNVGRQRVVECWSSNRERASSELGMERRQSASVWPALRRSACRGDTAAWTSCRHHLVGQHRGLVRDTVLHWQPVQQPQQRRCVCATTAPAGRSRFMQLSHRPIGYSHSTAKYIRHSASYVRLYHRTCSTIWCRPKDTHAPPPAVHNNSHAVSPSRPAHWTNTDSIHRRQRSQPQHRTLFPVRDYERRL